MCSTLWFPSVTNTSIYISFIFLLFVFLWKQDVVFVHTEISCRCICANIFTWVNRLKIQTRTIQYAPFSSTVFVHIGISTFLSWYPDDVQEEDVELKSRVVLERAPLPLAHTCESPSEASLCCLVLKSFCCDLGENGEFSTFIYSSGTLHLKAAEPH